MTIAANGMVATSHPLAAQVGLDVLKTGGNAVDAAIATNAAMGLIEPMSCGIGGDLFAIVWDAKTQKLYGLNASGRAPYKATRAVLRGEGAEGDSRRTARCPGRCPAASTAGTNCSSKFGTHAARPSCSRRRIALRRGGLAGPRGDRRLLARRRDDAAQRPRHRRGRSCPTASAPQAGEVFKNPAPGRTLPR